MRTRLLTSSAVLALLIAAPAAHASTAGPVKGTSSQGILLEVMTAGHALRVVNARHAVRSYTYAGRLPSGIGPGSQLNFIARGSRASHIRVTGHTITISFYGRVTQVGSHGVTLHLSDGRPYVVHPSSANGVQSVGSHKHRKGARTHRGRAGKATAGFASLRRGDTVLVGISAGSAGTHGASATTSNGAPKLVAHGSVDSSNSSSSSQLSGQVLSVDSDTGQIVVQSADGVQHTLAVDAGLLDQVDPQVCDIVNVTYHELASGSAADSIDVVDQSTDGACAGIDAVATADQTVDGTISSFSADQSSFTVTTAGGPLTFAVDPSSLQGFNLGDAVTVSYTTEDDGSLTADSVDPPVTPTQG
jgi:hypothetical protein